MSEQWIDLDTAPPELIGLLVGQGATVDHGKLAVVKETHDAWILHCPTCGFTARRGKGGGFEFLSRGKIRREGEHWLWPSHSWSSSPEQLDSGVEVQPAGGSIDTFS